MIYGRKVQAIAQFVKVLKLFEEPAYLITDYRVVVASNFKVQQKVVRLGGGTSFSQSTVKCQLSTFDII